MGFDMWMREELLTTRINYNGQKKELQEFQRIIAAENAEEKIIMQMLKPQRDQRDLRHMTNR